jgi:hypothetical protein
MSGPGSNMLRASLKGSIRPESWSLIFSSSADASPQIHREIERAVSKGLTIIPFRIEDIAPTRSPHRSPNILRSSSNK